MKDNERYWDCLDQAMEASHGGRTDEALAWLDEALRAHPAGAEARNSRGEILWDDGRVDDALYEFEMAQRADPKFTAAYMNQIELLNEELGEHEQAVALCDRLLAGGGELPRLDRNTEAELYYFKSRGYFYLEELEPALFLVRRAIKLVGELSTYRAFEGQVLFEMGEFEDARRSLARAVSVDPESPSAAWYLGLVLERLDEPEEAERAFTRADALDPDHFPMPVPVDDATFEQAVVEAIDNLPRSIREYVDAVPVLIEDYPSLELMQDEGISPQILGLFTGTPGTQAHVTEQPLDLNRVILFKKNLEKLCRSPGELIEQIEVTVKHEIGHYLGLDELDLERLGLA